MLVVDWRQKQINSSLKFVKQSMGKLLMVIKKLNDQHSLLVIKVEQSS